MKFSSWLLQETSLNNLRNSAIQAFPNTTKRQHIAHLVNLTEVRFTPFLGTKTLLVRANAHGENEYHPLVLFVGVEYQEQAGDGIVEVTDNLNKKYFLDQLSSSETDTRVRCQCEDFYWRFHHYDWVDKSLYGKNRQPYIAKTDQGPANPMELPGLCKHLMSLMNTLSEMKLMV